MEEAWTQTSICSCSNRRPSVTQPATSTTHPSHHSDSHNGHEKEPPQPSHNAAGLTTFHRSGFSTSVSSASPIPTARTDSPPNKTVEHESLQGEEIEPLSNNNTDVVRPSLSLLHEVLMAKRRNCWGLQNENASPITARRMVLGTRSHTDLQKGSLSNSSTKGPLKNPGLGKRWATSDALLSGGGGGGGGGGGQGGVKAAAASKVSAWGSERLYLGRGCDACSLRLCQLWEKESQEKDIRTNWKTQKAMYVLDQKSWQTMGEEERKRASMFTVTGPGKSLPRLAAMEQMLLDPEYRQRVQEAEMDSYDRALSHQLRRGQPPRDPPQQAQRRRKAALPQPSPLPPPPAPSSSRAQSQQRSGLTSAPTSTALVAEPVRLSTSARLGIELSLSQSARPVRLPSSQLGVELSLSRSSWPASVRSSVLSVEGGVGLQGKRSGVVQRPEMIQHVQKGRQRMLSCELQQQPRRLLAEILDFEIPGMKGAQTYSDLLYTPAEDSVDSLQSTVSTMLL